MNEPFSYLTSAELSDVGRRRRNNEDSVVRLPAWGVFCVADGMGGVQGGEMASRTVVETLQQMFNNAPEAQYAVTAKAAGKLTALAVDCASKRIKQQAEELGLNGAGSTVVTMVFDRETPAQALILHAGDSRAYRYRNGKLQQLSVDHSVAAAAGLDDEKHLPAMFRGVITRAVGLRDTVDLEETPVDVAPNDLFFLCSDGLSKMVNDKLIARLLKKNSSLNEQELAHVLIGEALRAGGGDNVSVVLIRVAAKLPAAPTLTPPPQTGELERRPLRAIVEIVADEPAERETGETAKTGETADPQERTKNRDAPVNSEHRTPPTPASGNGVTPPEMAYQGASITAQATITALPRRRHRLWPLFVALAVLAATTVILKYLGYL